MGRTKILSDITMFKLSVLVCLLGTILCQEDSFEAIDVAVACAAGTPLGDKMDYAFTTCLGGEDMPEMRRGKGKGGRKGRKGKGMKEQCPPVDAILESLWEEMEDDLCIMAVLGWIDENGEFNDNALKEDIANLPEEVSAQLTEEAVDECAKGAMKMIAEDPENAKCAGVYSEEDVASLTEAGMMVAASKCFDHIFLESCMNSMAEEKETDRFFFFKQTRGGCFATCQAARFAASTTCAGNSLIPGIWSTSQIPCNQLYPALAFLNGN